MVRPMIVLLSVFALAPVATAAPLTPPFYFDMETEHGVCRVMLLTEEVTDSALVGTQEGRALTAVRSKCRQAISRIANQDIMLMALRIKNSEASATDFFLDRGFSLFVMARPGVSWSQELRVENRLLYANGVDTLFFLPRITVKPGQTAYGFVVFPKTTIAPNDELYFFPVRYNLKRLGEP